MLNRHAVHCSSITKFFNLIQIINEALKKDVPMFLTARNN